MHGVAERGRGLGFAHVLVAAQNVVVLGIRVLAKGGGAPGGSIAGGIGAPGPSRVEAPGSWFVALTCKEGLPPPINTNSSESLFGQM